VYQDESFIGTVKRIIFAPFLWKLLRIHPDSPGPKKLREETLKSLEAIFNKRQAQIKSGEINQEDWKMDFLHRLMVSYDNGVRLCLI
jgi:hypothetical protein